MVGVLHAACVFLMLGSLAAASDAAQVSSPPQGTESTAAPEKPQSPAKTREANPVKEAWQILRTGAKSEKTDERATAVRVLALIQGDADAIKLACQALKDEKPEVRSAGAGALGQLHARSAIPQLKQALSDEEVLVVLAAAHALVQLREPEGYEVYYSILTGNRKGTPGLVASQLATLKDPKKMAMLGFEEGIGFVPFAGIGYSAFKAIVKNDSSPVRAASAKMLTHDPDPETAKALADQAVNDKSDLVRTAALEAVSQRGDPTLLDGIVSAMFDEKQSVKYTAAAAVVHLDNIAKRQRRKAARP